MEYLVMYCIWLFIYLVVTMDTKHTDININQPVSSSGVGKSL